MCPPVACLYALDSLLEMGGQGVFYRNGRQSRAEGVSWRPLESQNTTTSQVGLT